MTWKKLQRLLACLLAVLLLSQVGAFSPAVFAADASGYTLQDGTAIIPEGASEEKVNQILTRTLVAGFDEMSKEDQNTLLSTCKWEYYCKSKASRWHEAKDAWGSVGGFNFKEGIYTYDFLALSDAKTECKAYSVRLTTAKDKTVQFTKAAMLDSSITLKEGVSVKLPYNEDGTLDFDALRAAILQQVVDEGTTPSLTTENTEIKYKHTVAFVDTWVDLDGGKIAPAISAGDQQIQISFKGDDTYKASSATTTVTFTERPGIKATTNENPTFKLDFTADGEAIYNNIRQQVWDAVVVSTNPTLTVDDVTIEYYATATIGAVDKLGHAWVALTGGKVNGLTYPAIGEGTQKVRITWGGSKDCAPWSWEGDVVVTGRAAAPFQLKQGVTEGMTVAMVYKRDQSINYEATAQALREALLESSDANVSINDVTVKYKAGLGIFEPLDYKATISSNNFGLGEQTIRFTWDGNADYQAYTLEVTVKMTDTRIVSKVMLKTGASITYNMDANAMLQAIFENLIDWGASTLPEKSTLSVADFTIEYYAENVVEIDGMTTGGGTHLYMPLEGGKGGAFEGDLVKSLTYPQMGAGEQQIRVTFKGDEAYRSSKPVEGNLTVNKAKVSVKVHSTSIYADEAKDKLGEGFVTTDPADKFDIYTIYGGMTSDVTGSVFVQLPERITNSKLLKLIDDTLSAAGKPTLSEIMQKGTTVGKLKEYLNDLLNSDALTALGGLLSKIGIDLDTLRQISNTLNKFPGLLDNVRVAFGTPDQAGIYTVYAITNNKNYETGVGTGMLLVKKHYSGVKLQWNRTIPNGKLPADEVDNFDFGATLMYDGNPAEKQTNVHYLYSGFTSKWKPYSSTTTPPTEPGRYVMTVVTVGGNYQAAPITRSFQITK